jgi:hypothetical protein
MMSLFQKLQKKRIKSMDDTGKRYASAIARQFLSKPLESFATYLPALLCLTALYGKGENNAPRRRRASTSTWRTKSKLQFGCLHRRGAEQVGFIVAEQKAYEGGRSGEWSKSKQNSREHTLRARAARRYNTAVSAAVGDGLGNAVQSIMSMNFFLGLGNEVVRERETPYFVRKSCAVSCSESVRSKEIVAMGRPSHLILGAEDCTFVRPDRLQALLSM